MQRDVHRAEMGWGVRADVTLGRDGQQRPADPAGPAVPAGRHSRAAVREAWPVDIAAGAAHRLGRDAGEPDVERVASCHADRWPGTRHGDQIGRAGR